MLGLHVLATGPRAPHPARWQQVRLVQLAAASSDRVAIQARDPRQASDSPVAVQSGEESGDEPPAPLVRAGDDPVDRLVLTSDRPIRCLAAVGAGTARIVRIAFSWLSYIVPYLPDQSDRAVRLLYSKC